jgi:hypothetical protein
VNAVRVLWDRVSGTESVLLMDMVDDYRGLAVTYESEAAHLASLLAHAAERGLSCVGGCEACEDIRARVPVPASWTEAS